MRNHVRVLDVDEAMRTMITYMDVVSIENLLNEIACDPSGRTLLQDTQLWNELLRLHFGGGRPHKLESVPTLDLKTRSWDWTNPSLVCPSLSAFLRSIDERDQFRQRVHIVRGDIGRITTVNDIAIDGLAFPTNARLSNHFIGAAAAIFNRAGHGLLDYVHMVGIHDVGDAVVTPPFNAGVKCLIHCVGPRVSQTDCYERLALVYTNAMEAARAQHVQCLGLASISTGALGVPPKLGSPIALRAIQLSMRSHPEYQGSVGVVCVEESVMSAFQSAYQDVLEAFNTSSVTRNP